MQIPVQTILTDQGNIRCSENDMATGEFFPIGTGLFKLSTGDHGLKADDSRVLLAGDNDQRTVVIATGPAK